jgi:hypothetical protein
MQVIINEKEYEYVSDYPKGWSFIAKDYFKFPVQIGMHKCFIKRFETKRIDSIPGWDLMMKLRRKNEANLTRVFDIVTVEEKLRDVHYVFQEYHKGATVEGLIKAHEPVDVVRFAEDVFNGLQSVHRHDYWFADFCEKNIFCNESGKFYLIDLDSCVPATEALTNDMPVSMIYWSLIFDFYREVLHMRDMRLSDIPAVHLNYLQLIFIVLHLKLHALRVDEDYLSDRTIDQLPSRLDQVAPDFRRLFQKFADSSRDGYVELADEVKALITEKILSLNEWPPPAHQKEEPVYIIEERPEKTAPPSQAKLPSVLEFTSSEKVINKGESYILNWNVQDAKDVQLYKNGKLFYKPGPNTKSIAITEPYDATENEIQFLIKARNSEGEVTSEPLTITVRDTFKIIGEGGDKPPHPGWKRLPKGVYLVGGLLILVLAIIFLFRKAEREPPVVVSGFIPSSVYEESPLIIAGENFPEDISKLQVLFNRKPGRIQYVSEQMMTVIVPRIPFTKRGLREQVNVSVICDGDTVHASGSLTVMRKRN